MTSPIKKSISPMESKSPPKTPTTISPSSSKSSVNSPIVGRNLRQPMVEKALSSERVTSPITSPKISKSVSKTDERTFYNKYKLTAFKHQNRSTPFHPTLLTPKRWLKSMNTGNQSKRNRKKLHQDVLLNF